MARVGHGVGNVAFRTFLPMAEHDDLDAPEQLLTPSEVAALFRVNPKTVTRWARAGKLTAIRTLGGHRRFRVSEIKRCLEEMSAEH
jgi:excisionase family DNA binding protein